MAAAVVALIAGTLIGLALGALGGGGSILAVPVLVYLLGQSPTQATTGSLVVVGVSSLIAAAAAHRAGKVLLGRGIAFGAIGIAGAAAGAVAATSVPESVLMISFAALMLVVGVVMVVRQRSDDRVPASGQGPRRDFGEPIITFSPTFACECPRALKVVVTATVVGLLTGFLGVGGGFLVVPALVMVLALPIRYAAGTSLVVITMTSAAALVMRAGHVAAQPDWLVVATLTAAATVAAVAGARLADRVDPSRLYTAFTALVLAVAVYTAFRAVNALI